MCIFAYGSFFLPKARFWRRTWVMKTNVQHTLGGAFEMVGFGVHTGAKARVTVKPADANTGVQLYRVEGEARLPVELTPTAVVDTHMCTKIEGSTGAQLQTVEHLFAAIHALGVDNVVIEVEGPEVPIVDGSSLPWVAEIDKVGLVEQDAPRDVFEVMEEKTFSLSRGEVIAKPADALIIEAELGLPIPGFEKQSATFTITPDVFRSEIAAARTFCRMSDVEKLRAAGMIQGGTLDCAVVFNDDGTVANPEGMRFENEPLRHKVLDAVGDLLLIGKAVRGHFIIPNSGHGMNNELARALVS